MNHSEYEQLAAGYVLGALEPDDLRARMAYPILVDARNALDADAFVAEGFTVAGVGRPVRTPGGGR
jgi:hypothetical protein